MKKFKSLKLMFLAALAASAAIATPVLVTSCATTTDNQQNSTSTNVVLTKYNAKQTKSSSTQKQNSNVILKADDVTASEEEIALDPNKSQDALNKANVTFKKLTKEKLQEDFDRVLTKFYNIYEFENEFQSGDSETEINAELQKVTVNQIKSDLTVDVTATFKVETETENKATDKEEEKTEIVDQNKTFTISPMFAIQSEIEFLTSVLQKAKDEDPQEGGFEIDVEDLYELYVGDKKDNEKSIFEEVEAYTTNSKLGGLLGYKIKLNDLQYVPENANQDSTTKKDEEKNPSSQTITGDTELFAPSFSVREYFQPEQEKVEGIDFSFDYNKLSQKTEDEIKALTKDNISDIFANITEEQKKLITKVTFEDDSVNNAINLTIDVAQGSFASTSDPSSSEQGSGTEDVKTEESGTTSTEGGTEGTQQVETTDQATDVQTISVLLQINKL